MKTNLFLFLFTISAFCQTQLTNIQNFENDHSDFPFWRSTELVHFKDKIYFTPVTNSDNRFSRGIWYLNNKNAPLESGIDDLEVVNIQVNADYFTRTSTFTFKQELYFTNDSYLYRTDGTALGTEKIKSIDGFIEGSLKFSEDKIIFYSNNFLWETDGTENGTKKIKDLSSFNIGGSLNSRIVFFKIDNTKIVISELDNLYGISIGTGIEINENLDKKIILDEIGDLTLSPQIVKNSIDNNLYFLTKKKLDSLTGEEQVFLAKTDGTQLGTEIVKELLGKGALFNSGLLFNGDKIFVYTPQNRNELLYDIYSSDGTETGTVIEHSKVFENHFSPICYKGEFLFVERDFSDKKLYLKKMNPNSFNETIIKELDPDVTEEEIRANFFIREVLGTTDTFLVTSSVLSGQSTWLVDINEESKSVVNDSFRGVLKVNEYDGNFLGIINDEFGNAELWFSNNAGDISKRVQNFNQREFGIYKYPRIFSDLSNRILFYGDEEGGKSSSINTETNEYNTFGNKISDRTYFSNASFNDLTYYTIKESFSSNNFFMYKTDGTPEGTSEIIDVYDGFNGEFVFGIFNYEDSLALLKVKKEFSESPRKSIFRVYFCLYDGKEITNEFFVRDIGEFSSSFDQEFNFVNPVQHVSSDLNDYFIFNSFSIFRPQRIIEVSKSNKEIKNYEILLNNFQGNTFYPIIYNNELFLSLSINLGDRNQLYKINNSTKEIEVALDQDNASLNVYEKSVINDKLLFRAVSDTNESGLWAITAENNSPNQIGDVLVRGGFYSISNSNPVNYFSGSDATNGFELWKTDGTTENTTLIKEISIGEESSDPTILLSTPSYLYFSAYDSEHGRELWRTDGTAEGTEMLFDLAEGPMSSTPTSLIKIDEYIYFWAIDKDSSGIQVWKFLDDESSTLTVPELVYNKGPKVVVFPNPTSEYLHFNEKIESLLIYSIKGDLVGSYSVLKVKDRVNVSALDRGTYILKIIDSNGVEEVMKVILN